jgi:hypothetical protein
LSKTTPAGIDQKWEEFKNKMNGALRYFEEIETDFNKVEEERSRKIQEIFHKTLKELSRIAYQQESMNLEIIGEAIMKLNHSITANQRHVLRLKDHLIAQIVTNAVEVENDFIKNRQTWKEIQIKVLVNNYEKMLNSNEVLAPNEVNEISDDINQSQTEMLQERDELFQKLREITAPNATKQKTYDWFQEVRAVQGRIECLFRSFLKRVHSAYSRSEERMKEKFSVLFAELDSLGATDEAITEYDQRFSVVIQLRVQSYHDTLKYFETIIADFIERGQKQLFKFKTFLIGLATLFDHHKESISHRSEQWEDEHQSVLLDLAEMEFGLEQEVEESINSINSQNKEHIINSFVRKAQIQLDRLDEMETKRNNKLSRLIKFWPKLIEYETLVYQKYLKMYFLNESREWKIGEMWCYKVGSTYACDHMDEASQNMLKSFMSIIEARASKKGNKVEVAEEKKQLSPEEIKRVVVKNYFKKRKPQKMIAWWWKETTKNVTTQNALLNESEPKEAEPKEAEPKEVEPKEAERKEADPERKMKPGPRRKAKKMFSRNRFANLVRRNSISLKTKGTVDSLVHHLGDTIAENKNIPLFIRNGSIMDRYLESIQIDVQNIFLNHANHVMEDKNEKAKNKATKMMEELENTLETNRESVKHRTRQVTGYAEQRKEVLQFHRTNLSEHQDAMTDCIDEITERKDGVTKEQDLILSKLDDIVDSVLPRMQNATNSKQLIEVNKDVQARFREIKSQMKQTVADYAIWSYEKGDEIRKSNRECIRGMKQKKLEATTIENPLRKIEAGMKKTIFICNKELEFMLPDRLRAIELAKIQFNDHRLLSHRADLLYLEAMQRTFTSAQIQLSSETSAIARQVKKMEIDIDQFAVEVDVFAEETNRLQYPCLATLKKIKIKKISINERLSDLVGHFNCTKGMVKDPKRDFYALWLSGKPYSMNDDSGSGNDLGPEDSNMSNRLDMSHRKSNARLRPMRSVANALGAVMRSRPSKVSVNFGLHLQSGSADERKSSKIGTLGMTRRKMLDPKMDLKQAIFGDPKPPTKDDFPCRLTRFLFQTTDKILMLAENYYRMRGSRPITRPNQIRENFERACDFTMFKIIDFERQAKDFCSKQFLEIRKMVEKFEEICHCIIQLIYQEENREQILQMPVQIFPECPYPDVHYVDLPDVYKVMKRFERLFDALDTASQEHFDLIRTSLGHPESQDELSALEKKERERQFKSSKAINERDKEIRHACSATSAIQIKEIVDLTEKYLLEDDERIAVSDLLEVDLNGDDISIKLKPYFIREKTWPEAALGKLPESKRTPLKTKKNTEIQKEIIKQRDRSIKMIESRYLSNLDQFDQLKKTSYKDLEFLKKCWDNSIKEIKMLYNTQ